MQVACDHCGAKYELDESEITGRGVRITCPSCSHVFVLYQPKKEDSFEIEVDLELDDNGELSMDLDDMLGAMMAEVEESISAQDESNVEPVASSASSAPEESTQSGDSLPPVSVPSESTDENNTDDMVETESQSAITSDQVASLDVHSLNFASVGIKSWKVKKPIGLMFEYSDYKTFQKSLNDGRISSGDQISPDGKNWTPMSEIENFELYFCRTYLEFEQNEPVEEVKQVKEKVISAVGGTNELASALAAAQAEVEQANRPQSGRKASNKRPTRKAPPKKVPEPTKSSSGLILNVGIGLVVVIGGYLIFGVEDTPPPVPSQQVQTSKPTTPAPDASVLPSPLLPGAAAACSCGSVVRLE